MNRNKNYFFSQFLKTSLSIAFVFIILHFANAQKPTLNALGKQIAPILKTQILLDAKQALTAVPISVTAESCER